MEENKTLINNETLNTPENLSKANKSFVLAIISLFLNITVVFAAGGLITGIIGLALSKGANGVTKKPQRAFKNIARPLSIANIGIAAVIIIALIILLIAAVVTAVLAALHESGVINLN